MRPLQLTISNFMSYERADVDFSKINLAAVVGPNGAGKSTILQAITFALWGEVRTKSHNDVVMRGKDECVVQLAFGIGGEVYSVQRQRMVTGKGSSALKFWKEDSQGVFIPLAGPTIKDTQDRIDQVVGLPYNVFVSSSLVQQGDAGRFSDARPGERKELMVEMLGLDWFGEVEGRARDKLRALRESVQADTATKAYLTTQIDTLDDTKQKLLDEEQVKRDIEETIKNGNADLATLRAELAEVVDLIGRRDVEMNELNALAAKRKEIDADLETLQDELDVCAYIIRNRPQIENNKVEYDRLAGYLRIADQEKDIHNRAIQLNKEISDQEKFLSESAVKIQMLDDIIYQLEDASSMDRQGIESLGEDLRNAQARLDEQEKAVITINETGTMHNADYSGAKALLESEKKRLDDLGDKGICPTCGQFIEDTDALRQQIQNNIASIEKTAKELLAQYLADIDELRSARASIDKTRADIASISSTISGCNVQVATREVEIKKVREEYAVALEAKRKLDDGDYCFDQFQELEAMPEIDYDPELHAVYKARFEQIKDAPVEYDRLASAEKRYSEGAARKNVLDDRVKENDGLSYYAGVMIGQIDELLDDRRSKEDLEGEIGKVEGGLATTQCAKEMSLAEIARLKALIGQAEDAKRTLADVQSRIGQTEKKILLAELLVRAVSKQGAPALLIEAALPQIEKDANEYLGAMAPGTRISLESQRTTLAGSASETLDIRVYRDGYDAPLETLSGGERFRADLAIRLAIGKMLQRKSGTNVDFLAIDEGFGVLDSDGQDVVLGVIGALSKMFSLVLVISHVPAVAEAIGMAGTTLAVSKVDGVSRIDVS